MRPTCLKHAMDDLEHVGWSVPVELDRLRRRVLGVAFRVHTALGPSLKEDVYRRCLVHGLTREGFRVASEVRVDLSFEGLALPGALRIDLIVEDKIVIEVKARDVALGVWSAQILSYLRHSGAPLGYVINFPVSRLKHGIKPYANFPPEPSVPSSLPS